VLAQDTSGPPNGIRAAGLDANPPSVGPIVFPATATTGTPFSYSAGSVLDVWDPAPLVSWAFGDGQTGPPNGTHTYANVGSFIATLTATDASGNTTTVHRTITVQTPSGGGGAGGGKPRLSHLKLTPTRFRAARSGASTAKRRHRAAPVGAKITYSVSLAATTRFTVLASRRGIRSGRRCVRARHPRPGARRCTLTTALGGFSHASRAGRASVRFSGRIGRHALKPGRYVLSAVARNRAGSSRTLRVAFTIVAR